jgi:lysophospholipase L1-like esterase
MDQLFHATARGWRGVAHASFVKWGLNGSGFRGPEVRPYAGQTRIVTYGASETFGIYEDPNHEFPRALERNLNSEASTGTFEVINAAIPGMRVGSGIAYLYDIGHELHPKIVVIYPTPTHYIGVNHPYCGRPALIPVSKAGVLPKSRVADKLKDRLKGLLPPAELTLLRKIGIAWTVRDQRVLDRVHPASLNAFQTDLHCAIKAVRDIGAIPILVTHANRFGPTARPDDDFWLTGWRLQYPRIRQSGLLDLETNANALIRSVADEEQVKVVDAASALSGDQANFADHAHFTNRGAAKMGALLSSAILGSLVAAGPRAHSGSGASAPLSAASR